VAAGLHDLGQQAHSQRLGVLDDAPGEDEVQAATQADDAGQALRSAIDERDPPAPLGEAELRPLGRDAQVAPQRQLQAAGQAPAGDRGDRGLGRRQTGEAQRAARVGEARGEGLDRLEVGPGAERDVAGAREHEHAGLVVGLEAEVAVAQRLGGLPVDRIAALGTVDGQHRCGADSLVADLVGHVA
jgi:hypothetical protein